MPWRLHVTEIRANFVRIRSFRKGKMGSLGGWVGGLRQVKLVGPSFACDAPPRSEKLRGNRFFAVRTFAATCYSVVGAAGNVGQQPTTHSAVAYRLAEWRPATERSAIQPGIRQYGC